MPRLTALAVVAALLITAAPIASPTAAQTTTSASGASCGCPQIKPVATDDKPAPGHIHGELTLEALEGYFSNREALYDGDWDKAMQALAHDIDPTGGLQISTGAAPPPEHDGHVDEGGISYYLLHGPQPVPRPQPGLPPRRTGPPQRNENDSGFVMQSIISTLARINKYGEPTFGLRKALMAAARFLARDLTRVPLDLVHADPHGRAAQARSVGQTAYGQLGQVLNQAALFAYGQDGYASALAKQADAAKKAGELPPPDYYDRANAALDIILSLDDKGVRDGLEYRANMTEGLFYGGVMAASLRSVFGASAASDLPTAPVFQSWKPNFGGKDSAAEAVGCKTFSILAMLAATDAKDGLQYRKALASAMGRFVNDVWAYRSDPDQHGGGGYPAKYAHSVWVAARALQIVAGMTDEDDPRGFAINWFEEAEHRNYVPPYGDAPTRGAFDDALVSLRDFEGYLKGPGRAGFLQGMQEFLADYQWRNEKGLVGEESGKHLMAAWGAAKPDWNPVIAEPLCAALAVPPKPILLVKGEFEDFQVDKFYIGVPMKVGLLFDEPYDADNYPVTVEAGGRSRDLVAHPVDKARMRYETDSFVP